MLAMVQQMTFAAVAKLVDVSWRRMRAILAGAATTI
jgi:hypothetical protein